MGSLGTGTAHHSHASFTLFSDSDVYTTDTCSFWGVRGSVLTLELQYMMYCNLRYAHKHISSKIPAGTKVTNMWGKIRIPSNLQVSACLRWKSQILHRQTSQRAVNTEQLLRLRGNKNKADLKEIHLKCLIYFSYIFHALSVQQILFHAEPCIPDTVSGNLGIVLHAAQEMWKAGHGFRNN